MAGPGCGLDEAASRFGASAEIIRGKDSAGAIIELEKRGGDLTRARVIDVVLGTGEAEIISNDDGYVELTIRFPAGATVRHVGQRNGHLVGAVPYGYDLNGDGKTLVPNRAEQRVIARIRRMRTNGKTLQAIAETLTRRHVPTKTGRSNRWTHQAVARILARTS